MTLPRPTTILIKRQTMDKGPLIAALRAHLQKELTVVQAAAAAAREGATHEEAKPENEYDTRALEQSYLAGAQTARAEALAGAVATLDRFRPGPLKEDDPVRVGAAVIVEEAEQVRRYLLCEVGGGTKLDHEGERWWVLTPSSPLGRALLGRRVGDEIERQVRGQPTVLEVLEVC